MRRKGLFGGLLGFLLAVLIGHFVFETLREDALLQAAQVGDFEGVRSALAGGADPDATFESGVTPLMQAVSNGHYAAAKVLLDAGADPNAQDYQGLSPMRLARDGKMWNLVNAYTKRGRR